MARQKTVLITGINRGFGIELCKQLSKKNYAIFGICKHMENNDELIKLTKRFPYIKLFYTDITKLDSLELIADELSQQPIDIIINNPRIIGNKAATIHDITDEEFLEAFKTNTLAPLHICRTFYKSIMAGIDKKFICISSNKASNTNTQFGGFYSYRASKAAMNALMRSMAFDLHKDGIKVLILAPGVIKTTIVASEAITEETSVTGMIEVIENFTGTEIAPFVNYKGLTVPW